MRKLFIGVIVGIIVVAAGYFGAGLWAQQRAEREVEASFAALRAAGGSGSHGKVELDLMSRTLRVADVVMQSDAASAATLKVGQLTATGIGWPAGSRFSADRLEAANVEVGTRLAIQSGANLTYKAPRIEITGFSGPTVPLRKVDSASPIELMRLWADHFVATSATSIAVPSVTVTMTPIKPDAAAGALGPLEYTYSDIKMRDMHDGRIAAMTAERLAFAMAMPDGGLGKLAGEIGKFAASDIDANAVIAMLDPAKVKGDTYLRAYRQVSAGPYIASFGTGGSLRIESITLDDFALKPSKFPIAELLAIIETAPAPGSAGSPAQARALLEQIATLYEGVRIGNFEMRDMTVTTPEGPFKIDRVALKNLENGRLGEFAFEGIDFKTPQKDPVALGRFALKGLDLANLMRTSAKLSAPGQQPTAEQIAGLLTLLEGAELKGFTAPYKTTKKPMRIDQASMSWGQFVGPIPTTARVAAKMAGPIEMNESDLLRILAAAGFTSMTVNLDIGVAWTEATRAFVITPVIVEVGDLFSASINASLGNVPREIFTVDPIMATMAAIQLEAGPVELVLRDAGALDIAVAQFASSQALSPQEARRALIDRIKQRANELAPGNPDLMPLLDAVTRFIEMPRGTLTVRLTPKGRVAAMELIEAMKGDPVAALARFKIEASATR